MITFLMIDMEIGLGLLQAVNAFLSLADFPLSFILALGRLPGHNDAFVIRYCE